MGAVEQIEHAVKGRVQGTWALSLPAGLHLISFRKDAGIAKLCTQLGLEPRIEREKSLAHAHDPVVTL
jgi:hypothetical protein